MRKNKGQAECGVDIELIQHATDKSHTTNVECKRLLPNFAFSPNLVVKHGSNHNESSELQGLLLLVSIAFQNVGDVDLPAKKELIPFLDRVIKDRRFDSFVHNLSILLFGMTTSPVSAMM